MDLKRSQQLEFARADGISLESGGSFGSAELFRRGPDGAAEARGIIASASASQNSKETKRQRSTRPVSIVWISRPRSDL